jgi:hypothetical protein
MGQAAAETNGTRTPALKGFVTERHFAQAEEEFPGISRFYETCSPKPGTFLELVMTYLSSVPTH